MRKVLLALVMMLAVTAGLSAETNYNTMEEGWYLNASLGLTINPLRFALDTLAYHRTPLMNKPGNLWKSTKVDWGVRNLISPALEYIGAALIIEPIAVFQLSAEVGYQRMFPTLGYGFLTFDSILDDYSSDTRKAITATNKYALGALKTKLQPSFRVAFGPVAIVHNITWEYMDHYTNAIVYDYANDILRQGADSYITHDTMLIVTSGDFRYGLAHHWGYMYGTGLKLQRAMLMGVWTPQVEDVNPYFILQAGYNILDHEYPDDLYIAVKIGANFKLTK